MADVTKEPVVLTTVPSEIEAVLIVEALRAYGINGRAVGGYASGFKVGAPGEVAIVVERDQLDEAKKAIAEIEEKRDRGRLAREASGADSWSESALREKACIPPGRIIAVFAVIGVLRDCWSACSRRSYLAISCGAKLRYLSFSFAIFGDGFQAFFSAILGDPSSD